METAVTPDNLHDFFVASAGVAGALIGLLFVAISVAGDRLAATAETQVNRIRAQAALTTFLNSLMVSLFALVSAKWLGDAALVTAIIGLTFVAGALVSLLRMHRGWSDLRDAAFLLAVLAVLVREIIGDGLCKPIRMTPVPYRRLPFSSSCASRSASPGHGNRSAFPDRDRRFTEA